VASVSASPEGFRSLSAAEFFYRNREIAGFSNPTRALYQTVRELVENALDAADTHGILPVVKVYVERVREDVGYYRVTVEDNGIGIPPQYVPQAFGQVLFSSKYVLRQSRGMFGLGAKMAILYGQMTTGLPVEVVSSPARHYRIHYYKILIDVKENKPIILEHKSWRKSGSWHGTIVSTTVEGDWSRARSYIYDYIRGTAVVAPYADIFFQDPDGNIVRFPRSISKMPPPPRKVKPHPHGVDIEQLKMLISASKATNLYDFLVESFQAIGPKSARSFLEWAGLVDPENPDDKGIDPHKMKRGELEYLARKLKEHSGFKAPRTDPLSPLGEEIIVAGLKKVYEPDFVAAVTRRPRAYSGHPFIVEAAIAYGGRIKSSDEPMLIRYANKIPLLMDMKSDVSWKVVDPKRFDWRNYLVSFPAPLLVLVHVCSTKVPFRGVGKESIADVPELESEIRNAVREVARRLRRFLSRKRREEELKQRIDTFLKYVPEVARSLSVIMGGDGEKELRRMLLEVIRRHVGLPEHEARSLEEKLGRLGDKR